MAAGADLGAGSLWQATAARLNADLGTLLTVAAPFIWLVAVAALLFLPAPAELRSPADLQAALAPRLPVWASLVFIIANAMAFLTVSWLAGRTDTTPRAALAGAVTVLPAYLLALLAYQLLVTLGLALFIVPGLYIAARMFPLAAVAALDGGGAGDILRRTWRLTEGHGASLLWFLAIATLAAVIGVLAIGIAADAVASVLTVFGAARLGAFAEALIDGFYVMVILVAFAVAGVVVRERLA